MCHIIKIWRVNMRILDETSNKSVSNLTLLLKKTEAIQLIGYLEALTSKDVLDEHFHLNNDDYSKEITVALYDDSNLNFFSDRYKLLVEKDE
jgi:midasin (ATPase involved in ribosome maturation)